MAARRFPEGRLHVDLRGHGPGEPLSTGAALAHLLVWMGVPADAVPSGEERARREARQAPPSCATSLPSAASGLDAWLS